MKKYISHNLIPSLFASVLTALIVLPIFGLKLERVGVFMTIKSNLIYVFYSALLVFIVQFIKPAFKDFFNLNFMNYLNSFNKFKLSNKLNKFNLNNCFENKFFLIFLLSILIIWPFFSSRNAVDIATLALIYIMLGLGLNIVVGFAGLLDLGFVGFYAVGAYTYALLFYWFDWTFWQALPLAGLMAATFGFLLGFPVLRLRGDYLAIVTLGFGEIIRLLLINLNDWTGGPDGISSIPKPTVFGLEMTRNAKVEGTQTFHQFMSWEFNTIHMIIFLYLMALILALITFYISNRLLKMPIGRAWEALREDEIACRSLGLNPMKIKLSAFTMGAMFAGFGGAFFAARQGSINPESFTFIESALILAIVVLGGMGSQLGVIIAAILITVLPELARSFSEYRMLIFGLIMILMMVWRPQGLLPMKRVQIRIKTVK